MLPVIVHISLMSVIELRFVLCIIISLHTSFLLCYKEPEVLGNINIEVSLPIQISELVKLRAQDLRFVLRALYLHYDKFFSSLLYTFPLLLSLDHW